MQAKSETEEVFSRLFCVVFQKTFFFSTDAVLHLLLPPSPKQNITGLALASGTGSVGAHEDVFPFSVEGGRRLNERKNSLAPYVENGHLFR